MNSSTPFCVSFVINAIHTPFFFRETNKSNAPEMRTLVFCILSFWLERKKSTSSKSSWVIESDLNQSKPNKVNIVAVDIIFCSLEAIARHDLAERVLFSDP